MTILEDLSVARRRLARAPGFTALAVLTLALGIGAHTSIFGLVDRLFLRDLPVAEPDRLVGIYESRDGAGFYPLSLPDYRDHRDRATVFTGLAAHYPTAPFTLELGDRLEGIAGSVVSPSYFEVLGLAPARGRFFRPEEGEAAGGQPVAVVSHDFWRLELGGRDDAVGTVLRLNATAFTVVGVAPEGFDGVNLGLPSEVWIPTGMAGVGYRWCDPADRDCTWVKVIGRLAPGRRIDEARAENSVLARQLRQAHPSGGESVRGLAVAPLGGVEPAARPAMLRLAGLLLAAVTLVLLVAAANLGGLLVARGLTRRKELAVRLAMGAPRRRVVSLFVSETLLLSLAGGAGGLLVASGLGRIVARLYPSDAPLDLGVSPTTLAYAAGLCLVTALVVGAVPGIQAARPSLVPALKDEATAGAAGPSKRRPTLLGPLVVAQVALSFVLLSSTGLLVRSLAAADRLGGVDPDTVATLRLRPRLVGHGPERAQAFTREVVSRLEALPGVRCVTLGRGLPPWSGIEPGLEGGEDGAGSEPEVVEVGPGLFEVFGFRLLAGREFDSREARPGGAPVAVVNRRLAEARWPGGSPGDALGRLLEAGSRSYEVVGVVEDRAFRSFGQVSPPVAYVPYWQDPTLVDARIAVRAEGDAAALLPALREAIHALDPEVPVTEVETLRRRIDRSLAPVHLAGRVLAASGALALLLSAVGLYGLLALTVARRTREIGIRIALGGTRPRVVRGVVWESLAMVAVALGVGAAAALLVQPALAHYLYGVGPRDPVAFAAALAVLALAAALASWWPARRAARVDPLVALRSE